MAERLDYRRLRMLLKEAARRAFEEIRQLHPGESFYAFALHTSDEATYAVPMANSEEGLGRTVARYVQKGYDADERSLRWSECDWAYHTMGEDHFAGVQQFIDHAIDSAGGDVCGATWERRQERLFKVFIESLKDLDGEDFFGSGEERNRIVLLLSVGEGEDEDRFLDWAQQLNPPAAFQWFKDFFSPRLGTYRKIGSRKLDAVRSLSVSGNQRLLSAGGWDQVLVFALPEYEEILKKQVTRDQCVGVRACAMSPDGKQVFVGLNAGGRKGAIQRWSVEKQKKVRPEFPPMPGIVCSLSISPDGRWLAVGCEDDPTIRIWDTQTPELVREISGHEAEVLCVRFSPSGALLASIEKAAKSLRLWDAAKGELIAQLDDRGEAIAFSPDGTLLAVVSGHADDRVGVRLWNIAERRLVRTFDGPSGSLCSYAVGFSTNGQMLASGGGFGGNAALWDIDSGKELDRLDAGHNEISDLAFLNDDTTIAVVGKDFSRLPVTLWDISAAKRTRGK